MIVDRAAYYTTDWKSISAVNVPPGIHPGDLFASSSEVLIA